jgi:hypothetical protein
MTLWYDAANLDADSAIDTIADGTNVLIWNDGSGNNRNAGQSAIEWSGWYEADGLDGKAVVIFDANDTLSMAPDVNGIKTVFAVFKQTSDENNDTKLFGGDFVTTSADEKVALRPNNDSSMIESTVSSLSYNVVSWETEAGSHNLYVNGRNEGNGTDPQTIGGLDRIGNDAPSKVAEIVAYDRVLPTLARQKLEGYLAHKWDLVGLLPSDHPYKISLPTFGGAQEVVFQPLPDRQVGQTVDLAVESSSGLTAFDFDSNDSTVVSITGSTVTALKLGTVTITATQPGDAYWFPGSAAQPFIATETPRADQTITFEALSDKTALDPDFD